MPNLFLAACFLTLWLRHFHWNTFLVIIINILKRIMWYYHGFVFIFVTQTDKRTHRKQAEVKAGTIACKGPCKDVWTWNLSGILKRVLDRVFEVRVALKRRPQLERRWLETFKRVGAISGVYWITVSWRPGVCFILLQKIRFSGCLQDGFLSSRPKSYCLSVPCLSWWSAALQRYASRQSVL